MPDGYDIIHIRRIRKGARYAGDYAVEWRQEGNKRPVRLITTGDLDTAVQYTIGFAYYHSNTKWDGHVPEEK